MFGRPHGRSLCAALLLALSIHSAFAQLQSPADGATNQGFHPNFLWDSTPWGGLATVNQFEIQIASDSAFTALIVDATTPIAHYVPANTRLSSNGLYYWRVRCLNSSDAGSWSSTFSFRVANFARYSVDIVASDTVADVRNKFALAYANRPATVRLAEDVSWSTTDAFVLNVTSYTNIWFNGNGRKITITNPASGVFQLTSCTNFIVSDFTVDYNPLPYVLCQVAAVDVPNKRITVTTINNAANPCLEINDPAMLAAPLQHMRLLDKTTPGRIAYNSPVYVQNAWQSYLSSYSSGGTLYHVIQFATTLYSVSSIQVGDYMLRVGRWNPRNILRCATSTNVCLDNVSAHASACQFASCIDGAGFVVVNCQTPLLPGRYCSVTADCVYARRNDYGPWVENCQFTANGDDCMNFHSVAATITSKVESRRLNISTLYDLNRFKVGDQIVIWDPCPGTTTPVYTTVTATDSANLTITTADDVGTVDLSDSDVSKNSGVWNLTRSNPYFYVGNCIVTNNARFGMMNTSRDGAIVGNIFRGCASSAIRFGSEPSEGLRATDILVRGNLFEICGYETSYFSSNLGVVHVASVARLWGEVPFQFHDGLTIVNNTISGWESAAMNLRTCTNALVDNNYVSAGGMTSFSNPAGTNDAVIAGTTTSLTLSNITVADSRLASPALRDDGGNTALSAAPLITSPPGMADSNGDGISDFLAYAFGLSPSPLALTGNPAVLWATGTVDLQFVLPAGRPMRYTAQVSSDLSSWNNGHSYGPGATHPLSPPTQEIEHTTLTDGSQRIRLRVTKDPGTPQTFTRIKVEYP